MSIAVIGDPHGINKEFRQLISQLSWLSLDQIWTVGDLTDRGPNSADVIDCCLENGIKSVMGNHDRSILNHYARWLKDGSLPTNPDKLETLKQLDVAHYDYLAGLPNLHILDRYNLVLVHGGLWPKIPLYAQPENVIRAQMILPDQPGKVRWWGPDAALWDAKGYTEEHSRAEGYERWYRLSDHEQDIIFGHSTWAQPFVYQTKNGGKCIGVDTGSCFGGSVTACVYKSTDEFFFVSVKAKKIYYPHTTRSYWEE